MTLLLLIEIIIFAASLIVFCISIKKIGFDKTAEHFFKLLDNYFAYFTLTIFYLLILSLPLSVQYEVISIKNNFFSFVVYSGIASLLFSKIIMCFFGKGKVIKKDQVKYLSNQSCITSIIIMIVYFISNMIFSKSIVELEIVLYLIALLLAKYLWFTSFDWKTLYNDFLGKSENEKGLLRKPLSYVTIFAYVSMMYLSIIKIF